MTTTPAFILRTRSPDDTRAAAAAAARLLHRGDVVSLTGELGAGKTCFVQGLARELGVTRRVTSPTFTLVRLYEEAAIPMVHCDVYRLDRMAEVFDLGDEVLGPDHLTVIEWGDAIDRMLPDDRIEVEVLFPEPAAPAAPAPPAPPATPEHATTDAPADAAGNPLISDPALEPDRELAVHLHGRWGERKKALSSALAPWLDPPAPTTSTDAAGGHGADRGGAAC